MFTYEELKWIRTLLSVDISYRENKPFVDERKIEELKRLYNKTDDLIKNMEK